MENNTNNEFTISDLAEEWERIWLDTQEEVPGDPVTAFQIVDVGTKSFEDYKANNFQDLVYFAGNPPPKSKPDRLAKDADGKLLCWQFAKAKKCEFGQKCKFSHKPAVDSGSGTVVANITEEVYSFISSQNKINNEHARKAVAKKWKKKYRSGLKSAKNKFSNLSNTKIKLGRTSNHQANNVTPDNSTNKVNFQDTVDNYKRKLDKKKEAANAAVPSGKSLDEKNDTVLSSEDDLSLTDMYSSDDSEAEDSY